MYELSVNNRAGRDNRPPAPALKANGENYPYRMFFNQDKNIVDADTPGECLAQLIPDYLEIPHDLKLTARLDLARSVQLMARATLLAAVDPDTIEEWEWAVLTYENSADDNTDPYGWGFGDNELGVVDLGVADIWSSKTPLVLIENNYDPYTDIRRPISSEGDYKFVSNIIWLEPSDEEEFLKSLSRIGFIAFGSPRSDRN